MLTQCCCQLALPSCSDAVPAERLGAHTISPSCRGKQIALDCAYGLAHLHNPTPEVFVHFDLKSPNILLTSDYNRAKIAGAPLL